MDYEKLYKEALERARTLLTNEVAVDIFPELAESKDELIKAVLLNFLKDELDKCGNEEWDGLIHTTDIIAWLEKQNELKPAEWSGRDQMLLDCTISSVWAESNRSNGYIDNDTARDIEKWLESFKDRFVPQPKHGWKPSEEQMVALKEACDEHWEPDGLDTLYTLYQDLKKLREE